MGDTYKDKARALLAAGFEPIPILKGQKRPAIPEWTTVPVTPQQVDRWRGNGYGDCGVGIRCTDSVQLLDVDVYDPKVAHKVWQRIRTLGMTDPCRRIGQHPKFGVPCRVPGQGTKRQSATWTDKAGRNHKIEVLARGQQFVCYGIHPDTHRAYEWQYDTLEGVGAAKLIEVKPEVVDELFDLLREEALKRGWTEQGANGKARAGAKDKSRPKPAPAVSTGDSEADYLLDLKTPGATLEELERALFALPPEYCDDRDYWVRAGMIVHWETQGSEEGYRLFDAWSRQSEKYKGEKDTRRRWKSFRLDREPEETATFGTLTAWLEEAEKDVTNVTPVTDVTNVTNCDSVTKVTSCDSDVAEKVTNGREKYDRVTAGLWSYLRESDGEVSLSMIYQDFSLKTANEKSAVRTALNRMCDKGLLEKVPMKRGCYMLANTDIEEMDLGEAEKAPFPLPMPFNLSNHVKVLVGSVVVVSGTTNAGKTAFAFQCVEGFLREFVTKKPVTPRTESAYALPLAGEECVNGEAEPARRPEKTGKPVRYLNSEMSEGEVLARIEAMGPESAKLLKEHVQWVRRSHDWARAIDPDALNVIDYLQIYDEFYRIGQLISDIQQKLRHGIAIVLIQKKTGEANPRGGEFALERCRLAINLDHNPSSGGGICTLRKVKAPVDYLKNPQGMELDYRLAPNMRLEATSKLAFVDKKQRANINRRYEEERKRQEAVEDFFQVDGRKDEDKEIPF